jgi:dTDP-4-amino-4,6-dideoxygalactose transaminase
MKVELIDLVHQYRAIQSEIDSAIRQVLEGGHFILGPNVVALEQEVAKYVGVKHAVGVASGTDALILSLRALGIGPGDEVILPTYTFFATAEAVALVGATPVLVDIEADTYCLDVQQAADKVTPRTRAIIPVHLYGHPADMAPLLRLAQRWELKVIEDNAQAFGAEYEGVVTGALGDAGCLSFFPSKNLGAFGDGGMVVTNSSEVADRVRMLGSHGWRKKYYPEVVGTNSRLDELQAAILRVNCATSTDGMSAVAIWRGNTRSGSLACVLARRWSSRGPKRFIISTSSV